MQRVSERHFGVLGAAFLLVALILLLALPGMAGAKTRIVDRRPTVDLTAPVTTDNAADAIGMDFTLGGSFQMVFAATDSGSGVEATYYSIDGRAWKTGTTRTVCLGRRFTGLSAGTHTFEYYTVDMIGNMETIKTCTIIL